MVSSFLFMEIGLAVILSLQASSITRLNSDNHYSNENDAVKFPFVLEEQLIFTEKQRLISGLYG